MNADITDSHVTTTTEKFWNSLFRTPDYEVIEWMIDWSFRICSTAISQQMAD
eukprot:SAG31_NODE_38704_length_292_cov_0.687179_1_plen_52_part_10